MIEQVAVSPDTLSNLGEQGRRPVPVLFWLAGIADPGIRNIELAEALNQEPERHYRDVLFVLRNGLTLGYRPQHDAVQLSIEAVMRTVINDREKSNKLGDAWESAKRRQPSKSS